jgi:hypothetical protein
LDAVRSNAAINSGVAVAIFVFLIKPDFEQMVFVSVIKLEIL